MASFHFQLVASSNPGLTQQEIDLFKVLMKIDEDDIYDVISLIDNETTEIYRSVLYLRNYIDDYAHRFRIDPSSIKLKDELIAYQINGKAGHNLIYTLMMNGMVYIRDDETGDVSKVPQIREFRYMIQDMKLDEEQYLLYRNMLEYHSYPMDVKRALSFCAGFNYIISYKQLKDSLSEDVIRKVVNVEYNSVNMIIPFHMKENKREYYLDNIHMYIGNRVYDKRSDAEIFRDRKCYFYYESREDLIYKAYGITKFLAFTPLSYCMLRFSSNRKLTTEETLEEAFDDQDLIMVYFGDVFYTFSVQEAIHAWKVLGEIVLPLNNEIIIPDDVIIDIDKLCCSYDSEDYMKLRTVIKEVYRKKRDIDHENRALTRDILKLPLEERESIRKLLRRLFRLGMYLRGWDGKEGKYPLREEDTMPNWDVQEKSTEELIEVYEESCKLDKTFSRFNCYELVDGNFTRCRFYEKLQDYLLSINKSEMCIRMASSILCNTSAYYLEYVFREEIDGYRYNLDNIQ